MFDIIDYGIRRGSSDGKIRPSEPRTSPGVALMSVPSVPGKNRIRCVRARFLTEKLQSRVLAWGGTRIRTTISGFLTLAAILLLGQSQLWAAENLNLNPDLNFKKNGWQGPLIMGDQLTDGLASQRPNYVIFYAGFCYNAKRQTRRTVDLYEAYRDRVRFVTVDLSHRRKLSPAQRDLTERYFHGSIPQTVIMDREGKVVFDYTGEAEESTLTGWLDSTLR